VSTRAWLILILTLALNWALMRALYPSPTVADVSYTFFTAQVAAGNVEEVTSQGDVLQGTFKKPVGYPAAAPTARNVTRFSSVRLAFATSNLEQLLQDHGVVINARALDEGQPTWWESLVYGFGPTLLLVGGFIWLSRRATSGAGVFNIGQSRAKRYQDAGNERVTFDDVAGIEDAKGELMEVVDFLQHPQKYQRLGGTMPKGVLLVGAPGTGKTPLARAVAGQAGVPFFSLSASEFIEMIVGVGAARVRDLFKQARGGAGHHLHR